MKLSDIMSAMHLEVYAEVALLIFLCVFLLVLAQVLRGKNEHWQRARFMALEESEPEATTRTTANESEQLQS
jgi:hypothetical protein